MAAPCWAAEVAVDEEDDVGPVSSSASLPSSRSRSLSPAVGRREVSGVPGSISPPSASRFSVSFDRAGELMPSSSNPELASAPRDRVERVEKRLLYAAEMLRVTGALSLKGFLEPAVRWPEPEDRFYSHQQAHRQPGSHARNELSISWMRVNVRVTRLYLKRLS